MLHRMATEPTSQDFDELFRAHYARAVALAAHVCGDRTTAEDIAQEVFWSLHGTLECGPIENVGAWITTALTRRCLNERRRLGRESEALRRHGPVSPVVEDFPFVGRSNLAEALRRLSPQQRLAILLTGTENMAVSEVATAMGCAPSTVRVHLARARKRAQVSILQNDHTRD